MNHYHVPKKENLIEVIALSIPKVKLSVSLISSGLQDEGKKSSCVN